MQENNIYQFGLASNPGETLSGYLRRLADEVENQDNSFLHLDLHTYKDLPQQYDTAVYLQGDASGNKEDTISCKTFTGQAGENSQEAILSAYELLMSWMNTSKVNHVYAVMHDMDYNSENDYICVVNVYYD